MWIAGLIVGVTLLLGLWAYLRSHKRERRRLLELRQVVEHHDTNETPAEQLERLTRLIERQLSEPKGW